MYALLNRLREVARENMALNDGMHSYHAAALVGKGNKVLAYGVNSPRGTSEEKLASRSTLSNERS